MFELLIFCGGAILGTVLFGVLYRLFGPSADTRPNSDWDFAEREQHS